MVIAFCGPSGIGKGYAKNVILGVNPNVREAVWYTTRELRPGETNRKSVSDEEFESLKANDKIVLCQNIFNHKYAIEKDALKSSSGIVLTELHPSIIEDALKINPDIVLVGFVTNETNLLFERLSKRRKTETSEEIQMRVKQAENEIMMIREKSSLFEVIIRISRKNEGNVAEMMKSLYRYLT